jgi:hypothetical protein
MAVLHPDGLVENFVGEPVDCSWYVVLEAELFDMDEAAGMDLAVPVLVGAEVIDAVFYVDVFVDVVEKYGALNGRDERGDQQAMIAARVDT